jgi:ATP-dependent Clp protease, protease subunit
MTMKNKLLKLLADNRKAPARRFEVNALDNGEAEIFLYDAIVEDELEAEYMGGVAPQSFVRALRDINATSIHLRINCPGGSVFAARAMETALREHPANITVHIDGVAASAATFIAMAGDSIIMSEGAMFMIHKAWGFAMGNSDDMVDTAGLLEKIDGTLADTYARKTGMDKEKCLDMMRAETWMTAAEALEAGFVDSIAAHETKPKPKSAWNLDAYEKAPKTNDEKAAPIAPPANELASPDVSALMRKLEVAALIP